VIAVTEKKSTRRGFLELILGGGVLATLGAIFYPVFKYIIPPATAEATLSQLKLPFKRADIEAEPKKAKYFKYGKHLGIIFITDKGELKALSATCTHLDCTVQNRPDWGIIWCACHNGKYDYDGKNISGPPPRPLTPYQVKVVDDVIFVSRSNA
jgi:Rieske Fe-S protein